MTHTSLHKSSSACDEDTLSKPHIVVHEMADAGSPPSHRRDEGRSMRMALALVKLTTSPSVQDKAHDESRASIGRSRNACGSESLTLMPPAGLFCSA